MKVVGPDSGEWRGMVDLLALRRSREAFESRVLPRVPPTLQLMSRGRKSNPDLPRGAAVGLPVQPPTLRLKE